MSEIFNVSSGEIAVAQNSYNRREDWARSSFDRPHRWRGTLFTNFPIIGIRKASSGHVLGGWQLNSAFSLQSGSPFTPLNGADPAIALASISALVGNAIRPNVITTLNLSGMSVEELVQAGRTIAFPTITAAQRVGNAGRNILRSDGINNIDLGILKNTRIGENHRIQIGPISTMQQTRVTLVSLIQPLLPAISSTNGARTEEIAALSWGCVTCSDV